MTENSQGFRLQNQQSHQQRAIAHEDIANDIFIQLTKLFITLSTFLITFVSPTFLTTNDIHETTKILLFVGWLFLVGSIIAGVVQIFIEKVSNENWSRYYHKITRLYASSGNSLEELEQVERQKEATTISDFASQSSTSAFAVEVFCFLVGLLLIIKVFHDLLFI